MSRNYVWADARRSLLIAAIVGTLLVIINHGPRFFLEPALDPASAATILLNYAIPFSVATLSALSMSGNTVTTENESYSPDGKTTYMSTATHAMNPPQGMESSIKGGPMDGARWEITYTPMGDKTKVDLEGDFNLLPGMDEKATWKILDDFFTNAFNEDNANLKK